MNTHIAHRTKHQLRYKTKRLVNILITWNGVGPLSDENKLQVDEKKNKTEKFEKILETNNIKNIKTFRYKLTPLRNIIFRSCIRRL